MTKETELQERLTQQFPKLEVTIPRRQRLEVHTDLEAVPTVLAWLKEEGYHQLTMISCVDWIEEGQFELVYHVASHATGVHVMVKARLDRENPRVVSIGDIYENAPPYEREIHEFFGVYFIGNPDLRPLYLDNWQESPPLRRDFDTRAYAKRTYDNDK